MEITRSLLAIAGGLCLATGASGQATAREAALRFRGESSLVLINASIFDRDGRPVTGLRPEQFRVFDEKSEVEIRQFHLEDTPVSTVILLDVSRSMRSSLTNVQAAVRRFVATAAPGDDFCVVTFNSAVDDGCEFSTDAEAVLRSAISRSPDGDTAFYDALIAAISKARSGRNARRAVLILSDGEDNASRFGWKQALAHAKESTACLYALAMRPADEDAILSQQKLKDLVETTGGRVFEVRRSADYPSVLDAVDVRRQYVIGYSLPAASRDGSWRRVTVQFRDMHDAKDLRVYWRRGYYSPEGGLKQ